MCNFETIWKTPFSERVIYNIGNWGDLTLRLVLGQDHMIW